MHNTGSTPSGQILMILIKRVLIHARVYRFVNKIYMYNENILQYLE